MQQLNNSQNNDKNNSETNVVPPPEAESLDKAAYHGPLGDLVLSILPYTEASPIAMLVQAIICFGHCIGRGAWIDVDGGRHFANFNAVIVGASAVARKGTSWGQIEQQFGKIDPGLATRMASGIGSGEGLIEYVQDPEIKMVEGEEKVVHVGKDEKRLLVQEGEFSRILKVCARKEGTLSPVLRDAWDSKTLRVITRSNSCQATGTHISVVGHITSYELTRTLEDSDTFNGFGNRFLWVYVKRSKELPWPEKTPELELFDIQSGLADAYNRGEITWSQDGKARWFEVYHALSTPPSGSLGAITSRGPALVLRLAMIYCLVDGCKNITREHLEAALAIWDYSYRSAEFIFGSGFEHQETGKVFRALRVNPDGLSKTILGEMAFKGHPDAKKLDTALVELQQLGRIVKEQKETAGRPSLIYKLA